MKRCLRIISVVLVLVCLLSAQETGRRIVTRTRLQVLFSDLETQWLEAVQQGDKAALNRLLSEEFEVWTPAPPGDPIPREDWQAQAFARPPQSFQLGQMAVRAVSADISVASFRLTETFGSGPEARHEAYFVVDVWTKVGSGDDWRCTDRYLSRVADEGPKSELKPSGKE